MLEKMGDARLALGLVGGAHLVPHHMGNDGSATIGNDGDLHAIRKRESGDIDIERAGRLNGQHEQGDGKQKTGLQGHGSPCGDRPEWRGMVRHGPRARGAYSSLKMLPMLKTVP